MFEPKHEELDLLEESDAAHLHEISIFSMQGRISRSMFWRRILLWSLGFAAAEVGLWFLGKLGDEISPFVIVILACSVASHIFFVTIQGVKRFHDLNKPGWFMAFNLTGVFLPICIIWLGCVPGTPKINHYGLEPDEAVAEPQTDFNREGWPARGPGSPFRRK